MSKQHTNDKSLRRLKDEASGGITTDAPDGPRSNDKRKGEVTNQSTYCGHPTAMSSAHAKAMVRKHGKLFS